MNMYKKGEHLLNAATVCLKLEKQQEKVLPFRYYEYNKERDSLSENEASTLKVNEIYFPYCISTP